MFEAQILIVEDDRKMREALLRIMKKEGYTAHAADTGEAALGKVRETTYDVVITDLKLPGIDGMEVLKTLRGARSETSIIIITAYATIDSAVEAMREGAEDYVAKPFDLDEIRLKIRKVLEKRMLLFDNRLLRDQLKSKYAFDNMAGQSETMIDIFKTIHKVKDSKATVLILGETGTGKELVARAIHFNSVRRESPFLPVNCGALNEALLESELFGHVKGAFTGAIRDKRGVFEVAHGGTIFLDEIGDVSVGLQQALLRVLENGEIQPVGSTMRKRVDVRVVAATNKDLPQMMAAGTFRQDLYYRLNVITVELPPLRERADDIAILANHFLKKYAAENGKEIRGFSGETMRLLEGYRWPGNVRELENAMARATLLETGGEVRPESLPLGIRRGREASEASMDEDLRTLEEVGRSYIMRVLQKTGMNKARAAEILGINRTSLWRMIQRLKITDDGQP
jgi:DNA-binding NtrC family response regulator